MKSAGLDAVTEFCDNAKATHVMEVEDQALIQLCGDPGLQDHAPADATPPADVTPHAIPAVAGPPPWTLPDHLQVIPSGRAFDIVDNGSSAPRVIGRVTAQMQDGGVRCTCKLPDHSDNSRNPCYIWLRAPGHYAAAIACIGEWLSEGVRNNADHTAHRTAADVQRSHFNEFAWSLANVSALCIVRACKRALACSK